MNSKIITQRGRVAPHTHKANNHSKTEQNVIPSVFHVLIAPLALSLASPSAGFLYLALAIAAYFTIFSDKNYFVKAILKTVAVFAVVGVSWFGLLGFIGKIASLFTGVAL